MLLYLARPGLRLLCKQEVALWNICKGAAGLGAHGYEKGLGVVGGRRFRCPCQEGHEQMITRPGL